MSKQLSARVDDETARKVRVLAAFEDRALADWVRDAIEEKLEREDELGNSTSAAEVVKNVD